MSWGKTHYLQLHTTPPSYPDAAQEQFPLGDVGKSVSVVVWEIGHGKVKQHGILETEVW